MCKEDIRLARAANAKAPKTDTGANIANATLPGNPNRYSLAVAMSLTTPATDAPFLIVYSLFGGGKWPLMSLSRDHPGDVVNLMDVGQAITGPIAIDSVGAQACANWFLGECAFDQDIREV